MTLEEAVHQLKEAHNLGDWLESRTHLAFTMIADDLFGDGRVTRDERIALGGGIGAALDAFRANVEESAPGVFERPRWASPPEVAMDEAQPGEEPVTEAITVETEFVPLLERALDEDGNGRVKLIRAGWGSSGFYGGEMLRRDGPKVFTAGTHMYWNHPTATEEAERPERNLTDLAAVFTGNAAWEEDGERGPGLYAPVQVFEQYRAPVNEMADHIGVSIRARGRAHTGEADGRRGRIIDEIVDAASTDFVTRPGAGGEIVSMFEAARPNRSNPTEQSIVENGQPAPATPVDSISIQESDNMELQELQERLDTLATQLGQLSEANETLRTAREGDQQEIGRLRERLLLADAGRLVQAKLPADLPTMTRQRLAESLVRDVPTTEAGEIDAAALTTRIEEAVKSERAYLASVLGSGRIVGMGESSAPAETEVNADEVIQEANALLEQALLEVGVTPGAAKAAVRGR